MNLNWEGKCLPLRNLRLWVRGGYLIFIAHSLSTMIYSKISQKIDVQAGDELQLCSTRARLKRERTYNNKPSKSQKVRSTLLMNIIRRTSHKDGKVQLFWEDRKNMRNRPGGFDMVNVKNIRTIAQIFVAFSGKLNFTIWQRHWMSSNTLFLEKCVAYFQCTFQNKWRWKSNFSEKKLKHKHIPINTSESRFNECPWSFQSRGSR